VSSGVVAANGVAALAIDDGADVVTDGQGELEQSLVGADALHGEHAAGDFGDGGVPIGVRKVPVSPVCPPESP